jgi:hypothetical protein
MAWTHSTRTREDPFAASRAILVEAQAAAAAQEAAERDREARLAKNPFAAILATLEPRGATAHTQERAGDSTFLAQLARETKRQARDRLAAIGGGSDYVEPTWAAFHASPQMDAHWGRPQRPLDREVSSSATEWRESTRLDPRDLSPVRGANRSRHRNDDRAARRAATEQEIEEILTRAATKVRALRSGRTGLP